MSTAVVKAGKRFTTISATVSGGGRPVIAAIEEDGEVWDPTGTLVAQSRQLALVPRSC